MTEYMAMKEKLLENRRVTETLLVQERLSSILEINPQLDQLANWVLAFSGAAAAVIIANLPSLQTVLGVRAVAVGLFLLGVVGILGVGQKRLAYLVRSKLLVNQSARRKAVEISEDHRKQIMGYIECCAKYGDLARGPNPESEIDAIFHELDVSYDNVNLRADEQYLQTLSYFRRKSLRRSQKLNSGDPFWMQRYLLRKQNLQSTLVAFQLLILVTLLVSASWRVVLSS